MDAVREALGVHLLADAGVAALLGAPDAVYHRRALRGAVRPYVLFHRQDGRDRHTFGGSSGTTELWLVKAVDRQLEAGPAEDLAAAIHAALEDAPLVVAGKPIMMIVRETLVDYVEGDGAETIHHVGGVYRLGVHPSD